MLEKHRKRFGKVIIYFSEHNRFPYYDHFIHDSLKDLDITFIDPTLTDWGTEDWRNHATVEMLSHSDSEWVCSIEQDWFAKDWDKLLDAMEVAMRAGDMAGWMSQTHSSYIHPSFWYMKRELLDRLGADFGPHSEIPGSDHFGMMTYRAQESKAIIIPIKDYGFQADFSDTSDCFHLGGVNQNYLEFQQRYDHDQIHRPEAFYVYNYWAMRAPVPQSEAFMDEMKYVDMMLRKRFGNTINPETSLWKEFFKIW